MGLIVAAGLAGPPAHRKAAGRAGWGIGDGNNAGTWDTIVPSNYHVASGQGEGLLWTNFINI